MEVNIPGVDDSLLGYILMGAGVLAILLSFAARGRGRTGYTTKRSSTDDPVTGSRIERTHLPPRP